MSDQKVYVCSRCNVKKPASEYATRGDRLLKTCTKCLVHRRMYMRALFDKPEMKELVTCACGKETMRRNYKQHLRSRKHADWLDSQE